MLIFLVYDAAGKLLSAVYGSNYKDPDKVFISVKRLEPNPQKEG